MRVMVLVKADKQSESGQMPNTKQLADMGNFNDELVKAGVMLAGEGLHPSLKGKRVRFSGGQSTVADGPFTGSQDSVCGFWILKVRSVDEALVRIRRAPLDSGAEVELRPIFEAEDFGAEFTPELRAQEERQREEMARRSSSGG